MSEAREKRIEDYGLIGDDETAALVGRDATIEWLCMPRFDSEACFAALLGDEENGCWRMAPVKMPSRITRRYLDDTLILETSFETEDGCVTVTDFMPTRGEAPDIVRIVEGRRGRVEMASGLGLRFDYGQIHPLVRQCEGKRVLAIAGPDGIVLDFDVPIEFEDRWFSSRFTVGQGDRISFVMTWFASPAPLPKPVDATKAFQETREFWKEWVAKAAYDGPYRRAVIRSLITLKALTHQPTGGMVAAPTSSLPERPGGKRNWDYRYCWLRDSTFTLFSFLQAGMVEEAAAWVGWLRRAAAGEPIDLRPFYTVGGDRGIIEWQADWLGGFNGAKPVRFGNAASGQLQLDIYGELINTLHAADGRGFRHDDADALVGLLADALEEKWERPDAGIWESRAEPRHHTYSKVMCAVGFDRASHWFGKTDRTRSARYRDLAERARARVLTEGWDDERGAFKRAFDDPALDAATLRIPLVGFLPADDPRVTRNVQAIERELIRDGLVRRYATEDTDDGVGGDEGAFLAASFWLVDVYAMQDRLEEARTLFEQLCALSNDLGLLAEEAGAGRQLGNFPQALSHLSLVRSALNLSAAEYRYERSVLSTRVT